MRGLNLSKIIAQSQRGTLTIPIEAVEFGVRPSESFFVIKGSDRFAFPALKAYRDAVLVEIFHWQGHIENGGGDQVALDHVKSLREYAKDLTDLLSEWGKLQTKLPD
jgi:hypothetical protein